MWHPEEIKALRQTRLCVLNPARRLGHVHAVLGPGRIAQSPGLTPSKSEFLQQTAHINSCHIQRKQLLTFPCGVPKRWQNQPGDTLCAGKGGAREAGAGTRSKAYRPADSPTSVSEAMGAAAPAGHG